MSLDSTVEFLNKTEGRDKLGKIFQYGARIVMAQTKTSDPETSKKFEALFSKTLILTVRKYGNCQKTF